MDFWKIYIHSYGYTKRDGPVAKRFTVFIVSFSGEFVNPF